MHFLGIDWVGINADNGRKLLLSIIFIAILLGASWAFRAFAGLLVGRSKSAAVQTRFWTRQGISLLTAIILILGILSICSATRPAWRRRSASSLRGSPSPYSKW